MIRGFLFVFLLIPVLVVNLSAGEYTGAVGRLEARFSLDFHDDGSVKGRYSYPSRKGVVYTLRGTNPRPGELYLEEYTGRELTARCYLVKELTGEAVVWEGEMHNTDGRVFPMWFSRARGGADPGSTPAMPTVPNAGESIYAGSVGKLKANFALRWHDGGRVSGRYSYPARPGVTYTLEGRNDREGELYLEEFTGTRLTARCLLHKEVTGEVIAWEGRMYNTDGREFPMRFVRRGETVALPEPEPAWEKERKDELRRLLAVMPRRVTWTEFPRAMEPIDMVPLHAEGGSWRNGKITGFRSGEGRSTFRFVMENPDWRRGSGDRFGGEQFVLDVAREFSVPTDLLVGNEVGLFIMDDGTLTDFGICTIIMTHWRKTGRGRVEVRGMIETTEMWEENQAIDEIGRATIDERLLISVVPDKVAIERDPVEEFVPRGMSITRDFGIVIMLDAAGPGMLELESISLEPEERPWIFLGDRGAWDQVPLSQRTGEAG